MKERIPEEIKSLRRGSIVPAGNAEEPSALLFEQDFQRALSFMNKLFLDLESNKGPAISIDLVCKHFNSIKESGQRHSHDCIVQMIRAIENMLNQAADGTVDFGSSMITTIKTALMVLDKYETNDFSLAPSIREDMDRVSEQADLIASGLEPEELANQFPSDEFEKIPKSGASLVSSENNRDRIGNKSTSSPNAPSLEVPASLVSQSDNEVITGLQLVLDDLTGLITKKSTLEKELKRILLKTFDQLDDLKSKLNTLGKITSLTRTADNDAVQVKDTITQTTTLGRSIHHGLLMSLKQVSHLYEESVVLSEQMQERLVRKSLIKTSNMGPALEALVDSLSEKYGKQINFRFVSTNEPISENIYQEAVIIAERLIRHAAKHSIELPEDRRRYGKSDLGVVTISLSLNDGIIRIALTDDGQALPKKAVCNQAIALGLIDRGTQLTPDEIIYFVMAKDFSTPTPDNSSALDYSDLVKLHQQTDKLCGFVFIDPVPKEGNSIFVDIPEDLPVISVLTLTVRGEVFAFESNVIEKIIHCQAQTLLSEERIPAIDIVVDGVIHKLANSISADDLILKESKAEEIPVVLCSLGDKSFAISADTVSGFQDVILKSRRGSSAIDDGRTKLAMSMNGFLVLVKNPLHLFQEIVEA